MTKAPLPVSTVLSREELGEMYFDLQNEYSRWFGPWSNFIFSDGDPEARKKELKDKMAAIHAELGEDFIALCQIRQENKRLEAKIDDVRKNNDELENRIDRLENCVAELHAFKANKPFAPHRLFEPFRHCESKIPMDTSPSHLRDLD